MAEANENKTDTGESAATQRELENNTQNDPFAAEREAVRNATIAEANNTYLPLIRQREQEAAEARRRLAEYEERAANPPKVVTGAEFLEDPNGNVAAIVQREIAKQVAPLNEFVQGIAKKDSYTAIKNQLKTDPQFANMLNYIESELDANINVLQVVDPQSVSLLASTIFGRKFAAGQIDPFKNNTNNSNTNNREVKQPNKGNPMPPAAGATKEVKSTDTVAKRELTEDERRIARFNKMTDVEYLAYLESDGTINDMNQIGKAK